MYSSVSPYGSNFSVFESDERAIENVCVDEHQRLPYCETVSSLSKVSRLGCHRAENVYSYFLLITKNTTWVTILFYQSLYFLVFFILVGFALQCLIF